MKEKSLLSLLTLVSLKQSDIRLSFCRLSCQLFGAGQIFIIMAVFFFSFFFFFPSSSS